MGKVFEQNVKNKFDSELKNEEILSRMLTLAFKSMLSYLPDDQGYYPVNINVHNATMQQEPLSYCLWESRKIEGPFKSQFSD